jgi:hypothetical protein
MRFDLSGVEAFVNIDILISGSNSFTVPLFRQPPSPLGIQLPPIGPPAFSLGLIFNIDLVFTVSGSIDVSGGFFIKLPEDAFFEASLFEGALTNVNL